MAIIKQIKLPGVATPFDLRDDSSLHYLGKTITALTNGSTTATIQFTNPNPEGEPISVTASVNDYVLANGNANNSFYFNGTSWVLMDPAAAEVPVKAVKVDGTALTPDANGAVDITAVPATIITAGALATGMTATTPTVESAAAVIATKGYVDDSIEALPTPMRFIGTAGTSGTFEPDTSEDESKHLPAAATANEGWTIKVITNGTYASVVAEVGDVLISNGSAWLLVPSGDESDGTVTNIATGIGVTGGPITTEGTIGLAFTDSSTGTENHKLADTAATPTYTANSGRVFAVTVDNTDKLAVNVTPGTLATTVSDTSANNTVVTTVAATPAASTAPAGALSYCSVDSGVLTLNYLSVATATNAVFGPAQNNG